jgi:hypothetical protein
MYNASASASASASAMTGIATLEMIPEAASKEPMADSKKVPKIPPTNRCAICRHKLQLSDMECRCGIRHCSKHRMPEDHACSFDHKARDIDILKTQVVACVRDKQVNRI